MKYTHRNTGLASARQSWVGAMLCALMVSMWAVMVPAHADDGFLDPLVAFRMTSTEVPGAVALTFRVADGYYMYRERFGFSAAGDPVGGDPSAGDPASTPAASAANLSGVTLGAAIIPRGQVKFDTTFNKNVETYRGTVPITVPVLHAKGPFDLIVTSQGCSDKGVCYPPMQHKVHVDGAALQPASGASADTPATASGIANTGPNASPASPGPSADAGASTDTPSGFDRFYSQDYAQQVLSGRSLPVIIGIFFVLGLALSLLPCSLPMIPILSSIILGEGSGLTRRRGFILSLAYVLGMAVVYTLFGIAAAMAGQSLGGMLQNPWVLGAFALLLTAFALSLFGCYELQLPSSWQNRVNGVSQGMSGGKLAAVFVMGALSALVVGACMTAPLFGVLAFIAQTGNVFIGGISLFSMAIGMGVPLLVVGVGAGAILPRAGNWMESVKRLFAVILLGAAVWIVAPVLPGRAVLLAWALVLLLAAFGLNRSDAAVKGANATPAWGALQASRLAWRWIGRAVGALAGLCAAALVLGAAAGSTDPLKPLAIFVQSAGGGATNGAAAVSGPAFAQVRSVAQLDAATRTAGRPAMLFFHADWCTSCVEMERFVFTDATVRASMDRFALLEADVTANNADDAALLKRFGLYGPPGIIFFDAQGHEITRMRVVGYQPAERFRATLDRAMQAASTAPETASSVASFAPSSTAPSATAGAVTATAAETAIVPISAADVSKPTGAPPASGAGWLANALQKPDAAPSSTPPGTSSAP